MTQIIKSNGGGGGGGGSGDMQKSVYDPNNVAANAFDYDNFINTPTIPAAQIQSDWNEEDNTKLDYIKNKPTIPTVNNATLTIQKNSTDVATFTANASSNVTADISVPTDTGDLTNGAGYITGVEWGDISGTLSDQTDLNSALGDKANKSDVLEKTNSVSFTPSGDYNPATKKYVDDAVADLMGLGKFLSLWDATTGQPISFPLDTPYTYTTGDYFMVETVSSATPPVNYKPNGSSYTGSASSTTESSELAVGDIYIYDGSVWLLQLNHGKTVSFSEIAGSPSDNTNLSNALGAKADDNSVVKLTGNQTVAGTKTFSTSPVVPSKSTDATNTGTAIATEAQVYKKQDTISDLTTIRSGASAGATALQPSAISDTAYGSGWDADTTHAPTKNAVYDKINAMDTTIAGKQATLVNQTNIKSVNGNSLLGGGNLSLFSTTSARLDANGWSNNEQTVSVSGVTLTNTVIVSPAPASIDDYATNKVYCSAQGSNSLTFSCTDTPTGDISVNVLIMN